MPRCALTNSSNTIPQLQQLCIDELELALLREAEGAREVAQLEEEVSGRALLLERHEVPLLGPELAWVRVGVGVGVGVGVRVRVGVGVGLALLASISAVEQPLHTTSAWLAPG